MTTRLLLIFLPVLVAGWGTFTIDTCCPGSRFDVRAFGARGDGVTNDHAAIQAAIAEAHDGGGAGACVVLTSGIFLTGGLLLAANVTLFVDGTATLRASTNGTDYLPQFAHGPAVAGSLVGGALAHSAGVCGGGVLDGQAPHYVYQLGTKNWNNTGWLPQQFKFHTLPVPGHGPVRVKVLFLAHSENVTVRGVTLTDSPSNVPQNTLQNIAYTMHFTAFY